MTPRVQICLICFRKIFWNNGTDAAERLAPNQIKIPIPSQNACSAQQVLQITSGHTAPKWLLPRVASGCRKMERLNGAVGLRHPAALEFEALFPCRYPAGFASTPACFANRRL